VFKLFSQSCNFVILGRTNEKVINRELRPFNSRSFPARGANFGVSNKHVRCERRRLLSRVPSSYIVECRYIELWSVLIPVGQSEYNSRVWLLTIELSAVCCGARSDGIRTLLPHWTYVRVPLGDLNTSDSYHYVNVGRRVVVVIYCHPPVGR